MIIWIGAVSLMLLFLGLALFGKPSHVAAERRLQQLAGTKSSEPRPPSVELQQFKNWLTRVLGGLSRVRVGGDDVYASVRQRLVEGGFRGRAALSVYMGSRIALAALLAAASVVLSWSLAREASVLLIGCGAATGYLLPGFYVDRRRRRRQTQIRRGLADVIDLMVVCIEAGLGLGATLARVSEELKASDPIITDELRTTVAESRAGRGLMDALRSMSERTGNSELKALVALLIQTDRFGTPLVQTLRAQAEYMRHERMQLAEEAAQRAPVKMMLPASLIFMAVLLIMGAPAALTIMRTLNP